MNECFERIELKKEKDNNYDDNQELKLKDLSELNNEFNINSTSLILFPSVNNLFKMILIYGDNSEFNLNKDVKEKVKNNKALIKAISFYDTSWNCEIEFNEIINHSSFILIL